MSIKSHSTALTIIAAALTAGCATNPAPVGTPVNPDADVMAKIAASADRASLSMQRLTAIRAANSHAKVESFQVPPGLETPISITWAGPVDALVAKVAELSGYTFAGFKGKKPVAPIVVSVAVTSMSAFNILADAGAQAGSAADIVINPDEKTISVQYAPVTQSGGYPGAQ